MEGGSLTITPRNGLVHVELCPRFEITLETMRNMWDDVLPICEQHNCRRVLVEGEHPTRSMDKLEVFEHGRIVADLHLRGLRIAVCLYGFAPDELTNVFTSAANGSFNAVRYFDDPETALRWLHG